MATGQAAASTDDDARRDEVDPAVEAAEAAQKERERQERIRRAAWRLSVAQDALGELNAERYDWLRERDAAAQELSNLTGQTRFEFEGYEYERSWETDRQWDKDDVLRALTRKIREMQVDPDTGEKFDVDPVELTLKVIRDCASITGFKTRDGLKLYGLDPDEYSRKKSKPKYDIRKVIK